MSAPLPATTPWARPARGLEAVLAAWREDGVAESIALDHVFAAKDAESVDFPADLAANIASALRARGVTQLYAHQRQALELARGGRSFVVATPTASGKSLCYNLPILDRLSVDPEARALYLFPTKALSRDQEDALRRLLKEAQLDHGAITFDGDTPGDARKIAKERGGLLLTNPDMLHAGILPQHPSWARLFSNLRYVVIDELHAYRGVFGSHLANVLRRLQRVCAFHGSSPTFIAASATIGNPQAHAAKIVGREVALITESGAPSGARRVMIYNPPIVNSELGIRASYLKSAVRLAEDLIRGGVSTLLFGQSRNSVEVMLKYLRDRFSSEPGFDREAICAYRGGYLPKERRAIEAKLRAGEIRCVVATNALELGVDIGALDAVICAGYPGTVAGTLQRFGRAGRRESPSVGILVTSSAPLDQFVAGSPTQLLSAAVEHARIDPDNPEILIQHLKCASFELPFELSPESASESAPHTSDAFGDLDPESLHDALEYLADHGVLFPAQDDRGVTIYHWSSDAYPANSVSLRSVGWDNFVIIDVARDKTIAEMDWRSAHTMLHEQAIYQHAGEQYQVERLDYENHKAFVRHVAPDYYTSAMSHTKVTLLEEDQAAPLSLRAPLPSGLGEVSIVTKVVGYKKIKYHTHENVGCGDVHLPAMQMHTPAFWLTFPERSLEAFMQARGVDRPRVIDALSGLLSAMHWVGAVGLMVDPRDLGSALQDQRDPEHGASAIFDPTLFLYDQVPGGVGLASRLFEEREALVARARAAIARCRCEAGCPACVGPSAEGASDHGRRDVTLSLLDALQIGAS